MSNEATQLHNEVNDVYNEVLAAYEADTWRRVGFMYWLLGRLADIVDAP